MLAPEFVSESVFSHITSVEFCNIHYPRIEDNFQDADS